MNALRDYLKGRVQRVALKNNAEVYEIPDYSNCGLWVFMQDDKTVAKLYYDFQSDYYTVREGNGNIYGGVYCKYGNDADTEKMCAYIEQKIKEGK